MRCLIVDNAPSYASRLCSLFEERRVEMVFAHSLEAADQKMEALSCHAVLLRLALPGEDPVEWVYGLRAMENPVPVIMVADNNDAGRRVAAFEAGADDCVSTSIDPAELLARFANIQRRKHDHTKPVIQHEGLEICLNSKVARYEGSLLKLQRNEFMTLEYLALNQGRPVSWIDLFDNLYGSSEDRKLGLIRVYVQRLRKKLAEVSGGKEFLVTMRGHGIMFAA